MKSRIYERAYNDNYGEMLVHQLNVIERGKEEGISPNILSLLDQIEVKVRTKSGRINWIWVLLNIGKIIAAILATKDAARLNGLDQ